MQNFELLALSIFDDLTDHDSSLVRVALMKNVGWKQEEYNSDIELMQEQY
jgi:hypothetical protein